MCKMGQTYTQQGIDLIIDLYPQFIGLVLFFIMVTSSLWIGSGDLVGMID